MMNTIIKGSFWVFCSLLFLAVCLVPQGVFAGSPAGGPPFMAGQVVVHGTPDTLPAGYSVVKVLPHAKLTVVAVEPGKEFGHLQSLRAKGYRAGLNLKLHASVDDPLYLVDDPLYSYQWHLHNLQSEAAWGIADGAGAFVAVLDTGLATQGAEDGDGIGDIGEGYNAVNLLDEDPVDGNGHGTHVAGTIGQATNNEIGVAGLAYGATIMPVKVLDDSGSGSIADIADGIWWAVDKEVDAADVINMSLGTNARFKITNNEILDPALDHAYDMGVTVVCAAGNDNSRKNVSYPAIYPTTIAVGAVGLDNTLAPYSNRGIGLDLMAPGGNMAQDLNNDGYADGVLQETFVNGEWKYYFFQGTSMASPHVAAAAAMLIGSGLAITPDDVYSALTSTSRDLGLVGFDSVYGHGLVQVYDALTGLPSPPEPEPDPEPEPEPEDPPVGECLPRGDTCDSHDVCCSGMCHPVKGECK